MLREMRQNGPPVDREAEPGILESPSEAVLLLDMSDGYHLQGINTTISACAWQVSDITLHQFCRIKTKCYK